MAATLYASSRRAGQYIGLIDTPPYIQHDESRVNSVFGSGGRTNMLLSSIAAAMTELERSRPRSRPDSATVRPPMRWVASCVGAISDSTRADLVDHRDADRELRGRDLDEPPTAFITRGQRFAEKVLEQEDLDVAFAHPGDELVVLVLGSFDPEHVVEQQPVVVGGRQPLQAQLGPMDHHLPQPADL